MTTIHADLEAIQSVRAALLSFAARVYEALPDAEFAVERGAATLDRQEDAARRAVNELTTRLYECHAAAMYGYPVNYYHIQQALWDAEQRLTRILHLRRRFDSAVNAWRSRKYALERATDDDLAAATGYLDRRITALESYYATTLATTALNLGRSGIPWLLPATVGALRLAIGHSNRALGRTAEEVAAAVLSERFGLQEVPFTQPAHGFDRIFRAPGLPVIVVESKASHDGKLRLGQTLAGEQGSPGWNAQQADNMADSASKQWSPANERIGRLVQTLGPENVPVLAVVVNHQAFTADVYQRQPDGAWQVLEAGIDLQQVTVETAAEAAPAAFPQESPAHQPPLPSPWSERNAELPAERREGVPGGAERRG